MAWKGEKMYHYVEDKQYIKQANIFCSNLVNQLVQRLNNIGIKAGMYVVGSKRRNMITQNEKEPIDFDYNVLIENVYSYPDIRRLKEDVRKTFNDILSANGLDDCDDSTSALTTKQIVLDEGNKTPFSIDVALVGYNRSGQLQRLIHKKAEMVEFDQYYWNIVPDYEGLEQKIDFLKPDHWIEVRKVYLKRKNLYLSRQDHDHPSFVCYIEAVNEVYDSKCNGARKNIVDTMTVNGCVLKRRS